VQRIAALFCPKVEAADNMQSDQVGRDLFVADRCDRRLLKSDALYALDTISFRIEIVGSVQSSLPNRRIAGAFGEFSIPGRKFPQP
jgi:hypothetical protein